MLHNSTAITRDKPSKPVIQYAEAAVTETTTAAAADVAFCVLHGCRYFHYTGFRLPMTYNTNAVKGIEQIDGDKLLTVGGAPPIVLHFASTKPWNIKKDDKMWRFANLCKNGTEQQQQLRKAAQHARQPKSQGSSSIATQEWTRWWG
jgi:hypothetical protein